MHDYFVPLKRFTMRDLFDGRMAQYGVQEKVVPGLTSDGYRCLIKDSAFVWAKADGYVLYFACGRERPYFRILSSIAEAFGTMIYAEKSSNEEDHTFWGPVNVSSIAEWEREITSTSGLKTLHIAAENDISHPPSTLENDATMLGLLMGKSSGIPILVRDHKSGATYRKRGWPTISIDHDSDFC